MPELPEVEIHAQKAREWLVGRRLRRWELLDPLLAATGFTPPPGSLEGRQVDAIRRRAKYLLVDIEGGHTLILHLRMTGKLIYEPYVAGPPAKPTRLLLEIEEGGRVRFDDVRRFGRARLAPTQDLDTLPELALLGPDALQEPTSAARLRGLCGGSRRRIKSLLMDQRLIGGLGNICATEILFRSRVAPDRPAGALSEREASVVAGTIVPYLEWAISAQARRDLLYLGEPGAENVFSIYGRAGSPCPRCGAAIVKTVVAGRGTFHCPGCQTHI